jgi:hypothetical protein
VTKEQKDRWAGTGKLLLRGLAGVFITPVPVMVALGIWHLEIDSRVPALGYWPTLGILWGLGALLGKVKAKWDPNQFWSRP